MRPIACIALMFVWLWCAAAGAAEPPQCQGKEPGLSKTSHQVLVKSRELTGKKQYQQALQLLSQYSAKGGSGHHVLSFWQGYLNYLLGRLEQAAIHLQKAVKLWPCMSEAWRNLAIVRADQKRPAEAAELMEKAYHYQKPKSPETLYQVATLWIMAKKPDKAVVLLEELAAKPQPKVHWLEALVRAHLETKDLKRADEVLEKALMLYPGKDRLWRMAAWLAADQRNFKRSAAALGVAYGLKPPPDEQWRQLGDLYRAARVPAKAATAYERAFGPKPKAAQLDILARTYLYARMPDKALDAASQAFKAKPTEKRLAMIARIHLSRRDLEQAMRSYERAAKMDNKKTRYWMMAARLAWRLGKLGRAERHYGRAAGLAKPGSDHAKEAARALQTIRRYLEQTKAAAQSHAQISRATKRP